MSRDEENIDETLDDGLPGEGPGAANPKQPTAGKSPAGGNPPDEEDLLFEPTSTGDTTEEFGTRQQFAEDSSARWGGDKMDADEIGIPVESEPGYLSSEEDFALDSDQELEVVDDESQLDVVEPDVVAEQVDDADAELVLDEAAAETIFTDAAETVLAEHGDDQAGDGEFFVLDEADRSGTLLGDPLPADNYPVEEGWEPVGEGETSDSWLEEAPVEGAIDASTESLDLQPALVGGDDFGERYHDQADDRMAVVAAAPPRSGRILRMMTSMAAAVMVVGAGAVVVLRPEWLGLHFEPQLVERVQVARPNVTVRLAPPSAPIVRAAVPVVPPPVEIVTTDPAPVVPTPSDPTPIVPSPVDPLPADPVAVADPTSDPATPPTTPTEVPRYLPVGDSLWIGDFDGRQRTVAEWAPVRLGAKAFAQLQNGNYFVGSVKAVNSDALILTVPAGEVTLLRDEIEKVATLDSQEYSELQQMTTGFLRLSNRNRLVGAILKSVVDDNYVLQMRSDRVVVPRSAVEQVVSTPGSDGVRFSGAADEDEWLRGIAAQQLRAMSTGLPAAPAGEARSAPGTVRKDQKVLPIQEAVRKAPVERAGK